MSNTIVDMAKVTQMLDSGWTVKLFKNELHTYTAMARRANDRVYKLDTDDFTPEQALTRLAYKVHGEVL